MTPEEQLRARPSFVQAEQGYLGMLSEMRTALSQTVPSLRWREDAPSREGLAGCGSPFDAVAAAESASYTSGHATGAIPDDFWPTALGDVEGIALSHGFARTVTVVDERGNHVVSIYDKYAAEVSFGTRVNTVFGVIGGVFPHGGCVGRTGVTLITAPTTTRAATTIPMNAAPSALTWRTALVRAGVGARAGVRRLGRRRRPGPVVRLTRCAVRFVVDAPLP